MNRLEKPANIIWHEYAVTRETREQLLGQSGCLVWFTGLSGSGKSTIANAVDCKLQTLSVKSYILDGDNLRHGLNASEPRLRDEYDERFARRFGLGFATEDRRENIRRVAAMGQLFVSAGLITLAAVVSPYREDREAARRFLIRSGRSDDFIEVYVNTPIEICESRDPKRLYEKARARRLSGLTGIDAPYEAPEDPQLMLPGGQESPAKLADRVIALLVRLNKIPQTSATSTEQPLIDA